MMKRKRRRKAEWNRYNREIKEGRRRKKKS